MSEARFRHPDALVTTDWLAANLADPDLRIFDCTTYLVYEPGSGQPYTVVSGQADYAAAHIPGAGFLDLQEDLSDHASPFRFTMPAADQFAAAIGRRGVGDDTRVVLYSAKTIQWASRVWWMLRSVGFDAVAILDGGWDKWSAEGRPESTEPCRYPPAELTPRPRPGLFVGPAAVRAAIGDPGVTTINALAPDLHSGANPRYGRPGRIPGSVNLPAAALLDPVTRTLPSAESAQAAFAAVGAAPSGRLIVYCGGGIAATLDGFLAHQLGYTDIAIYDNSMSEWATDETLPIETD